MILFYFRKSCILINPEAFLCYIICWKAKEKKKHLVKKEKNIDYFIQVMSSNKCCEEKLLSLYT